MFALRCKPSLWGVCRLVLALWCAAPVFAADSLSINTAGGYARLVISPDPAADVRAELTDNVLIVRFPRPTTISPATLVKRLTGFVQEARIDPDGKTLRLAMSQSVRLQQSSDDGKTALDLVPRAMAANPPPYRAPKQAKPPPFDPANPPAVRLRVGSYRSFTRLVFDWPKPVPYRVTTAPGRITVRFEAPAKPDMTAFAHVAPPWVKLAGARVDGGAFIVELTCDSDSGYHDFRDGPNVVVDVLAPKTDVAAYDPPGTAKPAVTAFSSGGAKAAPHGKVEKPPAGEAGLSAAQVAEIRKTASTLNEVPLTGSAKASKPEQAKPDEPPKQTLAVEAAGDRDGMTLSVAGMATHGAAVFLRGTTLWVAVEASAPFAASKIKDALGATVDNVDAAASGGISVMRIGLKGPMQVSAFAQGPDMRVRVSRNPLPPPPVPPQDVLFSRTQDEYTHSTLSVTLPGAVRSMTLNDPDAKDRIVIIPGALGQRVAQARSFVEFTALSTAAGMALVPYVDDLSVRIISPRITIARGEGLALTHNTGSVLSLPAHEGGKDQTFLDFDAWGGLEAGSFLATERALRGRVVRAKNAEALKEARLRLARFFLANRFGAEALGVINQLTSDQAASNAQLTLMRAVADYQLGRYREAHNTIVNAGLESDRHAALWQGLIHTALGDYGGAMPAFERAMPELNRYALSVQIQARLDAAASALALGKYDYAKAQVDRLPSGLTHHQAAAADLVRARLASAWGDARTAAELFQSAEDAGDGRTQAEAIYYRIEVGYQNGSLPAKAAINLLERLRYRWRGDDLELKILSKLAEIYFKEKRWREGLRTLGVAVKYFPGNDAAIKAQEEMRAVFVALFLKGGANAMEPNAALGLFFDFIDLTPIGPDGDEMIRQMADRLTNVDLLGPAAELLNYQVTKRLDGMARAQVATRLAMVQLLDHHAQDALGTLISTNISTLPDDVRHRRLLLQARALAELKRYDEAIDLLAVDEAPDTAMLRADIYWQSGNWEVAGQKAEQILGDSWNGAAPLDATMRQWAMRAAIAYSLAGNETALDRVRARFSIKMEKSPDAEAFSVLTQRIDMQGLAFRQAAAKVAAVDTLRRFIQDLQKPD